MICNVCSSNTCTHHGYCHWPGCTCWCGCPFRWWWWMRKHFTRWDLSAADIKKLEADGYSRVLYCMDDIPPTFIPKTVVRTLKRMWTDHDA